MLAPLLRNASTTRTSVARALSIYSQVRMPAAKIVVDMSRENSYLSAFHTPGEAEISLPGLGERMPAGRWHTVEMTHWKTSGVRWKRWRRGSMLDVVDLNSFSIHYAGPRMNPSKAR